MKKLLRIAAVLSFGSFLSGGLIVIGTAASSLKSYGSYTDAAPLTVVGLILIGAAFFAGSVLWVLVGKYCPEKNDK